MPRSGGTGTDRNGELPVSLFLQLLEQRGLHIRVLPLSSWFDHIKIYRLDLADLLTLPGSGEVVLYSLASEIELGEETAVLLEEIVQTGAYRDRLKIIEYTGATGEGLQIAGQIPKVALFSKSELAQIQNTEPLKKHITKRLISSSSLASLNPYTYHGPVTGNRFFGREHELAILALQVEKSFVISGMRRSGKTSLMMEFGRRIQRAQSGELVAFVNFENCASHRDVTYKILWALAEQLSATSPALSASSSDIAHLANSRMWRSPDNIPRMANTIWKLISSHTDITRIRLLLDEYDQVVNLERRLDYAFTASWRDLLIRLQTYRPSGRNLHGRLQITFAGSRKLYEEILSDKSPLHNLATRLSLQNFDLITLTDIVTRPMREIGVVVQDSEAVAQMLFKITGGHPATTQHLCSLLVADPQIERTREVRVADIERAWRNPKFLGFFKSTVERNISSLGRFILAQMAINHRDRVNVSFIRDIARNKHRVQFNESAINVQLEDLAESGYLKAMDFAAGYTVYRLEVPTIPSLFSTSDADDLVIDLIAEGICRRIGG